MLIGKREQPIPSILGREGTGWAPAIHWPRKLWQKDQGRGGKTVSLTPGAHEKLNSKSLWGIWKELHRCIWKSKGTSGLGIRVWKASVRNWWLKSWPWRKQRKWKKMGPVAHPCGRDRPAWETDKGPQKWEEKLHGAKNRRQRKWSHVFHTLGHKLYVNSF